MADPKIKCPGCGGELQLRSVEKRGDRRLILCAHCDTLTEWSVDTEHE